VPKISEAMKRKVERRFLFNRSTRQIRRQRKNDGPRRVASELPRHHPTESSQKPLLAQTVHEASQGRWGRSKLTRQQGMGPGTCRPAPVCSQTLEERPPGP
jgi:hypothetical protein